MAREFLNSQQASDKTQDLVEALAPAPNTPTEPPQQQDALIGAFPAWDLLPTTNFVRRVK
ncbi:hypothetical protein QU481_14390 [Crenobacter sp. SG2303]|uniref:Uncharacterized protein n=1 Tax=Crenobacter oryzisoli TaxID=3056844 RepID=A0ABT7XQQ1_9NEIS|nr:hypothetical protein [Crenobacter sp. SG2303]MDN0076075.1 hypothetical protein [Crenobacter sp. SG2303]